MKDPSGYTRKTTDWLGREKEEHFDRWGNKIGETRFATDWLGRPKQEHYDVEGTKIGETRRGTDWLGRDRAEHFDSQGNRTGYSRDDTDWLGRPIQRHYDRSGTEVGTTRYGQDWLGRTRKDHAGSYFKAQPKEENPGDFSSSWGASTSADASGCFIATACTGHDAWEVAVLRAFRDTYLTSCRAGLLLLSLYGRYAPPVADWLRERAWARMAVRYLVVRPIASVVRRTLRNTARDAKRGS